ncbi:MAG: carboxypeptidase-like regulatory domain-containing protein [Methanoregula sp.]|jgi:opacity protein-like surface antigen|nr:carboxypeptidase-like regulatory domain-containing protein [Methanoregula sp.]
MYNHKHRFLFALFCIVLLCSSAQATDLLIKVQDSIDNTSIPSASVYVNGANYAKTNNYGQVSLSHNGLYDQLIRVSLTGYNDWEQTVGKNITAIQVNMSRKTLTLKINLYDSDTLEPVVGAKVNVTATNVSLGTQTGADGAAVFSVLSNNLYSVDIKATNYQPRIEIVDMGAENKEVPYWLLSGNRFSIVVKDKETSLTIPDAEVRIDSILAGKTDSRGIVITPVTRGSVHTFEVVKSGYQTLSESRTITDADAIYTVAISKAAVGLFIYVFDEKKAPLDGADIYFNGTLTGTTNEYGRSNFPSLVSGTYMVEVRKSGFVPVSRTIVISDQAEDYTFDLSFANAALSVFVKDKDQRIVPNAAIAVNGADIGVTDEQGQLVTNVKFNVPLNITASKEGYVPATVMEQVIQGNATASVSLTLEKNLDWGLIAIIGAGAVIILILFVAIRMLGGRKHRHILRRDEI